MTNDLTVTRGAVGSPGTGAVYLGNSGGRWLFWDGTNFQINGPLTTNGNTLFAGTGVFSGNASVAGVFFNNDIRCNLYRFDSGDTDTFMQWGGDGFINVVTNSAIRCQFGGNGNTQFWGNVFVTGDVIHNSDERLKTSIETIPDALDTLRQLRGVEYTRVADGKRTIGVIAQEIERVLPNLVTETGEGNKAVSLTNLIGLLIEAVKELSERVEELEIHA
jgi:hypothetical protein